MIFSHLYKRKRELFTEGEIFRAAITYSIGTKLSCETHTDLILTCKMRYTYNH